MQKFILPLLLLLPIYQSVLIKIDDQLSKFASTVPGKSPNDDRHYQAIVLENNLKVLFIYSQFITKSACSFSVGVGSLYNPESTLGLAHFLEHMLFMGSEKFPEENSYAVFIKENSGSRNAFTSDTETNFYFDIKNTGFVQAVQRLTNFFTSPLLKQTSIQKERNAVNEQFNLRVSDDGRRKWQIVKRLAQPPFSRFSTGNLQTLTHDNIRQDLINFYNEYYSSNIMNAVIYSKYSIQQMKKIFIPFLQKIPNKKVMLPQLGPHFTEQNTGKFVRVQSIKNQTILQFYWVTDLLPVMYKYHISQYVSYILGHQGINSLFSILKKRQFASQILSQTQNIKTQSLISLEIKLTDEGQKNYRQVYRIVNEYVASMKAEKYIYDEIRQRNQIDFQFKQKIKAPDYARQLATKMHYIPLKHIINSSIVFEPFQTAQPILSSIISQLKPSNLIAVLSSLQPLQYPETQPYLNIKYTTQSLPILQPMYTQTDQSSQPVQSYPALPPNPYLPISTTLYKFPFSVTPTPLSTSPSSAFSKAYLLQDSAYGVCKGGIQLRIYSQLEVQFLKFYARYLEKLLKDITYPAQSFGTVVEYDGSDCIVITIFGFADTVIKVVEKIGAELKIIHLGRKEQEEQGDGGVFDIVIKSMIQGYENFYKRKADAIADDMLSILLMKKSKTVEEYIEELKGYTYQNVKQKIAFFWDSNIIKWIVVGNFQQKRMKQLINKTQKLLKSRSKNVQVPTSQCLKLTKNIVHEVYLDSQQIGSSCAIVYYQAGPYSQSLFYRLQLLKNLIDQPYFTQLRTVRQLAYSLSVSVQNNRGILALKFTLVSSTLSPNSIASQIKSFVQNFFSTLPSVQPSLFSRIKSSLFTQIQAPLNNLRSLFLTIIREIKQNTFYFLRKKSTQINKYLKPIQLRDLKNVWDKMKGKTAEIWVVSKGHNQESQNKIQNDKGKNKTRQVIGMREAKQKGEYWEDLFYCCKPKKV